eukprot:COSAG04_NODE_1286_length_7373_cov_44.163046_4_plen_250_part_00
MVAWVGGCLATALRGSGDYDAWKDLTLGLMYAACALFVGDHVARWPNCARSPLLPSPSPALSCGRASQPAAARGRPGARLPRGALPRLPRDLALQHRRLRHRRLRPARPAARPPLRHQARRHVLRRALGLRLHVRRDGAAAAHAELGAGRGQHRRERGEPLPAARARDGVVTNKAAAERFSRAMSPRIFGPRRLAPPDVQNRWRPSARPREGIAEAGGGGGGGGGCGRTRAASFGPRALELAVVLLAPV